MPTLAAPLDFAKLEARNIRGHQLGAAPASPVTGQLYYNTADNTLYWWDGTAWVSARGGVAAVPDASPSVKGIVQLAGDLAGTAASPQIAAGVITDAEVAAANKDGANATPGMRTLGMGPGQAMNGGNSLYLISANNASAGPITASGQRVTNVADPTAATDGANKQYVDALAQGLDPKQSVKAATTPATGTVSLTGTQTIDGIALIAGDRVLIKNQSGPNGGQNGIYVVAAGAWSRAADMNVWAEVPGAFCFVEQGTVNADTGWVATADQGGTLDTTNPVFVQFSGAGEYVAGAGLVLSGQTFAVGAGAGLQANADDIQVANNGITNAMVADGVVQLGTLDCSGTLTPTQGGTGQTTVKAGRETGLGAAGYYSSATHGAGTSISILQSTHTLRSTRGLLVQVQDEATGNVELADVAVNTAGDVTVTFGASVAANSKRVTVIG